MFESSKKDAETRAKPLWSTIGPIFNEGSTHHKPKNCKLSPASKCTKSSTESEDTGKSLLVSNSCRIRECITFYLSCNYIV